MPVPRLWHKSETGQFRAPSNPPWAHPDGHVLVHQGKYLLVTSRDRSIYVYQDYTELVASVNQAHARIIWSATWISDHEFVTVSRDKHIKTWRLTPDSTIDLVNDITVDASCTSVTAVDELVVVGSEDGCLLVYDQEMLLINTLRVCSGEINDLKWQDGWLAIASADHSLHVLSKDRLLK